MSTHDDLVRGIQDTVEGAGVDFKRAFLFLHGSTIVINTLLERTGAQTALLITEGFRDIYEIGRINRPDAYNLFFDKHKPLVPRSLRFEVPERLLASGETYRELDEEAVNALAQNLAERGIESVAVLLLHSYRNPDHERRVKEIIQKRIPGAFVSASHELTQEYREFERASTVAANAYVGPRVQTYLGELEAHLKRSEFPGDFYAVQSTGGLFPVADARRDVLIEAMAAHEVGHCWRYAQGSWHLLPAGFTEVGQEIADSPELLELSKQMRETRREEGFSDLVALAWTQQRHPEQYGHVYGWMRKVRGDQPTSHGSHDTRAWLALAPGGNAFPAGSGPFEQATVLWRKGLLAPE